MGVYFVFRSYYEGPTGRYVRKFRDATVLEWFRNHWHAEADVDAAHARAEQVLGRDVYGFEMLFETIAARSVPVPRTDDELEQFLRAFRYPEGELLVQPGAVQAITDDDEIDLAWFLFDDGFLRDHPERATILLHDGWKLPNGYGDARFQPATRTLPLYPDRSSGGATYAVFLSIFQGLCLRELEGPYRIDGVRLPDLCAHLTAVLPADKVDAPQYLKPYADWPWELKLIRTRLGSGAAGGTSLRDALARVNQIDVTRLMHAQQGQLGRAIDRGEATGWHNYWRGPLDAVRREVEDLVRPIEEERRQLQASAGNRSPIHPPRDPSRSLFQVDDHVAQVFLHDGFVFGGSAEWYHQWIFFDDLWASAHPALAESILRYGGRWDALS